MYYIDKIRINTNILLAFGPRSAILVYMYKAINGYTRQMMLDVINSDFKDVSFQVDEKCDSNGNPKLTCMYRDNKGNKCAAGLFMADKDYSPAYEGLGVTDTCMMHLRATMPLDMEGMVAFQKTHDRWANQADRLEGEVKADLKRWVAQNVIDE